MRASLLVHQLQCLIALHGDLETFRAHDEEGTERIFDGASLDKNRNGEDRFVIG